MLEKLLVATAPIGLSNNLLQSMKLVSALIAAASASSVAAFAPSSVAMHSSSSTTSSPSRLQASYLDSLGPADPMGPPGEGYGPSDHWSTARNGGGYQYANPYSSTQPGYEATAYGQCDSDHHGYSSELRALEGNYYDARGPNLGYDDDLKFVGGGRGVNSRPVRGSATGRTSGWRDGGGPPPGMDYYPGEQDRTPGNYRDASTSAHNSWWDNPGQSYQVARGAQGSFRTYTDVQRDRHGPRRNF